MKNLHDVILGLNPEFEYRVKFACEPSKEQISKLSAFLTTRYDAFEIHALKKTIFQVKPLDFADMDAGEIWMFDFKCRRGVSTDTLMFEIGSMFKWSESLIRVRCTSHPMQEEIGKGEDDINFDEVYVTKMTDTEFKDAPFSNEEAQALVGQTRADEVVDAAKEDYKKDRTPYAKYMAAGFGKE